MTRLVRKPALSRPPPTPAMLALGRALGALMAADGDLPRQTQANGRTK